MKKIMTFEAFLFEAGEHKMKRDENIKKKLKAAKEDAEKWKKKESEEESEEDK